MSFSIFQRVPWGKFFLLWFLAVLMGTSLLWLHFGFSSGLWGPAGLLVLAAGLGLLWATTRPRWQKAHCSWCAAPVVAKAQKFDKSRGSWVLVYQCAKCGHVTEKLRVAKGK